MSRVATIPLQQTMAQAIQRAQQRLSVTQAQLSTGKKALDYSDLGTEAVRTISAHTLLARQDAESSVAKRVGTTLTLYDSHLSDLENGAVDLRNQILQAVGTGHAAGLQEAINSAFGQFRTALNADEGGTPLFGGGQTSAPPFAPATLAEVAGQSADVAFADDGIRATARVGEGTDMTYGIGASDVGRELYSAFQTLAQAGSIGETPTQAQLAQLSKAVGELDQGAATVRAVSADNGRRQAQLDAVTTRGDQRATLFKSVIAENEDADLGQVAIDLAQRKATLEASYTVFSQLAGLSLTNFLK